MRIRTFVIAFFLIIMGGAPALGQARLSSDTAFASMVAAERAFAQQSLRVNTQRAFLTYMAESALIYRPRAVRAHAYLRARPMPDDLMLAWEPTFADISASGDLGYTTGPWIASSRSNSSARPSFGQYVTIWRRQQDGSWKAELDAGIPHAPDPVGPALLRAAPAAEWHDAAAPAAARVSLLAADSTLAVAAKDGVSSAFQRRATDHMRLLRRGRFPITADSATAYLRATRGYTWQPVDAAVSRSGDLGYTYGVYAVVPVSGGRANETGDYLRIWRRDESGTWRVALDLTSPAQ